MSEKEMQFKQKQEVQQSAEPTKPMRQFVPAVDIYETESAVTVLAEMPGVVKDNIDIHLEDNTLIIQGETANALPAGKNVLLREFESGRYVRSFSVAETIDQEGISAGMQDGVLKVVLPKVKPAQPRKIEVQSA